MAYPCKGILIDPFACTVTEVDLIGDYTCIYPLLSHESMPVTTFEATYPENLKDRDAVFVDEEGLLKSCDRFFLIAGHSYSQPLAGKGLVIGADAASNAISPATPLANIRKRVLFFEHVPGAGLHATDTPWTPPKPRS